MPLYNRERDFTQTTLQDIRDNLRGETIPYRELSQFWTANGDVFDIADPAQEIQFLESTMTDLRGWMSEEAPKALDNIEADICQLDTNYAVRCDEVTEEIVTYGIVVDLLIEAIGSENFAAAFSKAAMSNRIKQEAPSIWTHGAERRAFYNNITEQFGFDINTAIIMWKVWNGIKGNNPEADQQELDYMFARALSQLCYNKGGESAGQWRAGAGYVYGYSTEEEWEYFKGIGLSIEEYNYLRYKVRVQNNIVSSPQGHSTEKLMNMKENDRAKYDNWKESMEKGLGRKLSDKEFEELWSAQYNSYCVKQSDGSYQGKTDYAHMMYVIAGCCVDDNAAGVKSKYPPWPANWISGTFWDNHDTRRQFVGWLGDATYTGKDKKGTSFGPDDYTADLDADNIRKRMTDDNISFMQASKEYYADLEKDPYLRTKEFKKNNSYNDVQQAIFAAAKVKNMEELKEKDGWSDSYDFLKSLENDDPNILPYH